MYYDPLVTQNTTRSRDWSIVVGSTTDTLFLQPLPHHLAAMHHNVQINSEDLQSSPKVAPAKTY